MKLGTLKSIQGEVKVALSIVCLLKPNSNINLHLFSFHQIFHKIIVGYRNMSILKEKLSTVVARILCDYNNRNHIMISQTLNLVSVLLSIMRIVFYGNSHSG